MICASVVTNAIGNVEDDVNEISEGEEEYEDAGLYRSAAGWMIFVAIMAMIIEILLIVIRILNISIINKNFIIFGIAVSQCLLYVYITGDMYIYICDWILENRLKCHTWPIALSWPS